MLYNFNLIIFFILENFENIFPAINLKSNIMNIIEYIYNSNNINFDKNVLYKRGSNYTYNLMYNNYIIESALYKQNILINYQNDEKLKVLQYLNRIIEKKEVSIYNFYDYFFYNCQNFIKDFDNILNNIFKNFIIKIEFLFYFNEDLHCWFVSLYKEKFWWLQNNQIFYTRYKTNINHALDHYYNNEVELNLEASLFNMKILNINMIQHDFLDQLFLKKKFSSFSNFFKNNDYTKFYNRIFIFYVEDTSTWYPKYEPPFFKKNPVIRNWKFLRSVNPKHYGLFNFGVNNLLNLYSTNILTFNSDYFNIYNMKISDATYYNEAFSNKHKWPKKYTELFHKRFEHLLHIYKASYFRWFWQNYTDGYYLRSWDQFNTDALSNILGGYTYWYGWSQDHPYYGLYGAGGVKLWDIKWILNWNYMLEKDKFFRMTERLRLGYIMPYKISYDMTKKIFNNFLYADNLIYTNKVIPVDKSRTSIYTKYVYKYGTKWFEKDELEELEEGTSVLGSNFYVEDHVSKYRKKKINRWNDFFEYESNKQKLRKWSKERFNRLNQKRIYWMILPNYSPLTVLPDAPLFEDICDFYDEDEFKVPVKSMKNLDYRCNKFNVGIRGYFLKEYLKDIWFKRNSTIWQHRISDMDTTGRASQELWSSLNYDIYDHKISHRHFRTGSYYDSYFFYDGFLLKPSIKDWETEPTISYIENRNRRGMLLKKEFLSIGTIFDKEDLFYINLLERKLFINYILLNIENIINNIKAFVFWYKDNFIKTFNYLILDYPMQNLSLKTIKILKEIKESFFVRNFINNYLFLIELLKIIIKYSIILFIFFLYAVGMISLITALKSLLPNNIIYGVKSWNKKNKKKLWYKEVWYKNNILKLLNAGIPSYIYTYEWNKKKKHRNIFLKKKKVENKIKNKLIKNYKVLYKKLIFEEGLKKLENNTKVRFDLYKWDFFWDKYKKKNKVFRILKLIKYYYRDRIFNHSKSLNWIHPRHILRKKYKLNSRSLQIKNIIEPELLETSRIIYYHLEGDTFRALKNIWFVFAYLFKVYQIWDLSFYKRKWSTFNLYGKEVNIDYKGIREALEKNWYTGWFEDIGDINTKSLTLTSLQIVKNIKKIKNTIFFFEKENKKLNALLEDLIYIESFKNSKIAKKKLKYILENYKDEYNNWEIFFESEKKKKNVYDKSHDLKKNSQWIINNIKMESIKNYNEDKRQLEQRLKYKYIDEVYDFKLFLIKKKYVLDIKNLNINDNLEQITRYNYLREVSILKANQEYEKRVYNYKHNIIDKKFDEKEDYYYNNLPKYLIEFENELSILMYKELDAKSTLSQALFYDIENKFSSYRWYSTIGARINYLFNTMLSIYQIWKSYLNKLHRNEKSFINIIKIPLINLRHYILKFYWEYIIISKDFNTFKKKGFNIKKIIIFSLITLWPISLYVSILYIIFIIYGLFYSLLYYIWNKMKYSKIFDIKIDNNLKIRNNINKIFFIFNILFKDLKTGESLIDKLSIKLYLFLGCIQRNIYFIKGAYILGKKTGNWWKGLQNVLKLFKLKFAYFLSKKNNIKFYNWKDFVIFYKKLKNLSDLKKKLEILIIFFNLKLIFRKWKNFFKNQLYFYFFKFLNLFGVTKITFLKYFPQYFKNIKKKILYLKNLFQLLTIIEIIILFFNIIFKLLKLPYKIISAQRKNKYIKEYKNNLVGIWRNPKYKIVNNKKIIKQNWKIKLHLILINQQISRTLNFRRTSINSWLEEYIIYKKSLFTTNMFLRVFRDKYYDLFYLFKHRYYTKLYDLFYEFESNYIILDKSPLTITWPLFTRLRYMKKIYKIKKHNSDKILKEKIDISRDLFLLKKKRDYNKTIRRYFIKGIINWISYFYFKKVIFKEVKNLKNQFVKSKFRKYNYIKYNINNVSENIHLGTYLENTPPELWALVIIQQIYYKNIIQYFFAPADPYKFSKGLQSELLFKWRLSVGVGRMGWITRARIAFRLNMTDSVTFGTSLSRLPYDPLLRFFLFLVENYCSKEQFSKKETWADISLVFLTYYKEHENRLKYETSFDINDPYNYGKDEFYSVQKRFLTEMNLRRQKDKKAAIISYFQKTRSGLEDYALRRALMLHDAYQNYSLSWDTILEEKKNYWKTRKHLIFELFQVNDYLTKDDLDIDQRVLATSERQRYFNLDSIEEIISYIKYDTLAHHYKELNTRADFVMEIIQLVEFLSYNITVEEISTFIKSRFILNNNENAVINNKVITLSSKAVALNNIETTETVFNPYFGSVNKMLTEEDFTLIIKYFNPLFITYNESIENYELAKDFKDIDPSYWSYDLLDAWVDILMTRSLKFKNYRYLNIQKKELDISIFIQNVKWTWQQWLHLDITEKERSKIYAHNLLILNERHRFWNLKEIPIRAKLPISLELDYSQIEYFLDNWFKMESVEDINHYFGGFGPRLTKSLAWLEFKERIEKRFNQDAVEVIFKLLHPDNTNEELNKFKKEHKHVFRQIIQKVNRFSKLTFDGLMSYTWDLIRYHHIWVDLPEEFDYTAYMSLKEQEQVRNTDIARDYIDNMKDIVYYRYDPERYYHFWIKKRWKFRFFMVIVFSLIIYILDVIFYHPGEYIHNIMILWAPLVSLPLILFMEKYIKPYREWIKGRDLYLYKYQAFLIKPPLKKGKGSFFWSDNLKDRVETDQNNIFSDRWWRTNRAVYKKNKTITMSEEIDLAWFLVCSWITFFLFNYRFLYREAPFIWDFYDEDILYPYLSGHTEYSFDQRSWFFDSWYRLEFGGNPYTVWYVNTYRRFMDKALMELDFGTIPKKSIPMKITFKWNNYNYATDVVENPYRYVTMDVTWGDVEWMNMTMRLENLIHNSRVLQIKGLDLESQKYPWSLSDHEIDIFYTEKVRLKAEFMINLKNELLHQKTAEYKERILQEICDDYAFDPGNLYRFFILESKRGTENLINADIYRYNHAKDNKIDLSINIMKLKEESLETGIPLSKDILLQMTELEKHLNILYYNFMQYKIKRLDSYLQYLTSKYDVDFLEEFSNIKKYDKLLKRINYYKSEKMEIEILHVKLKKYIENTFIPISDFDKIKYKLDLLLNLIKNKELNLILIKEILDIIFEIIKQIW